MATAPDQGNGKFWTLGVRRVDRGSEGEIMRTAGLENRRRARARYTDAADGVLVDLAADGDEAAFASIVVRHGGLVRAVARGVLGPQDAEDACQEVWTLVWRRIGGFRGECALTTWLYRVALNACLSTRRKDERRRSQEGGVAPEATSALTDVEDGPEASVLSEERQREARELLFETLPHVREEHRAAFVLRHREGLSYAEMAEALGVPQGTAKGWVHRGRLALIAAVDAHATGSLPEASEMRPTTGGAGRAA